MNNTSSVFLQNKKTYLLMITRATPSHVKTSSRRHVAWFGVAETIIFCGDRKNRLRLMLVWLSCHRNMGGKSLKSQNLQICDTEGGSDQLHFLVWDKIATVLCTIMYEHVMSGKHSSKHYDLDIWQNLQAKQKRSIYFTNTKAEDCVNIDYFRSNNIIFMIFFSNS